MADNTTRKILCYYCAESLSPSNFYISTDPLNHVGLVSMCKGCCEKVARNYNPETEEYEGETEQSIKDVLIRIDRPWFDSVYQAALKQSRDPGYTMYGNKRNVSIWGAYIQQLNFPKYSGLRWIDGEAVYGHLSHAQVGTATPKESEAAVMFESNREDVIRLVGYDPFEHEAKEDKPLMYAMLLGYIDAEGNNDDMTRILDSIEIVRGYTQMQKLGDLMSKSMADLSTSGSTGLFKVHVETKKKLTEIITQLAEQSCISLKHNKNAKKGENTWTGKIKRLKDLNLREAEINGFDIGTCRGMQQVVDMSNASIIKQLHLDESEYSDMIAEQRQMVTDLTRDRDMYKEVVRILLRENLDLKDELNQNGVLIGRELVNLNELFSPFADIEVEEDGEDADDETEIKDSE